MTDKPPIENPEDLGAFKTKSYGKNELIVIKKIVKGKKKISTVLAFSLCTRENLSRFKGKMACAEHRPVPFGVILRGV
ncbi:MAG: hypothetical protein ACE5HO_21835 [bacterium]